MARSMGPAGGLPMPEDVPIIIELVEFAERIEEVLPRLDEMIDGGLVTLEKSA
jgi:uncharacterized protein